ncbi:AEC family transporter [Sulfuriflexus mobilis]|uniref:AEC family transporter n=1 Tax=Sulfuriflexus mobilis TaxID=1811807 RepID=UPI000F824239|nr:AEC family transporter [Sulfuriflexus mobilis]
MYALHNLVNAVLVIVFIYALAIFLRRKGTLKEEHSLTLARIVTDLCLPAIIFVTLAKQSIQLDQMAPALVMLGLELFCIALAWGISVLLKFNKAQQGAIVFCSAFGSSTFLGYSIIIQMFPHTPEALSEAVLISEIGVGYPIFILGPILAAYFGSETIDVKSQWKSSLGFFKSPVFFALLIGLFWGGFQLPGEENVYLAPLFQLSNILASALTPLAILSVGLMFKLPDPRKIIAALTIVILLKLIIKPLLASSLAIQFGFPELWQEVLVLLAAMPPAVLGVVFLRRHGGDASLASALLLIASLVSIVTLVGVFWTIG